MILGPKNEHYRPLEQISPHLRTAFIVAEDRSFHRHHGFDLFNIQRALLHNVVARKVSRGASTISQQVAKNVFLNHHRTLSRKLQETVLTWRIEQLLSKRRILELYLNLVELGAGIYGVQQASQHYFARDALALTPLQAAHLAAVAPSPKHWGPQIRNKVVPRRVVILMRMMRNRAVAADGRLHKLNP